MAAILGVAAIGVGEALSMRGGHSERQAGGQPPIIVADKGPAKVVPENPGGLVIPDQNRQILERSPAEPPRPAKVVNSEEQPIDLKEAVRRESGCEIERLDACRAAPASAGYRNGPGFGVRLPGRRSGGAVILRRGRRADA